MGSRQYPVAILPLMALMVLLPCDSWWFSECFCASLRNAAFCPNSEFSTDLVARRSLKLRPKNDMKVQAPENKGSQYLFNSLVFWLLVAVGPWSVSLPYGPEPWERERHLLTAFGAKDRGWAANCSVQGYHWVCCVTCTRRLHIHCSLLSKNKGNTLAKDVILVSKSFHWGKRNLF